MNRHVALPKASDILANHMRALILGDGMEPDAALPSEAELMQTYGFSRGTVREALRLLEADGLIVVKRGPKGGIRVCHPDIGQVSRTLALLFSVRQTELKHLFTLRKLIEPAAAAEAARAATAEQKQWLVEIAPQHHGVQRSYRESVEFHGAIGQCSNNGVYEVVLAALHDALEWHSSDERLSHDDVEATRRAHVTIAKAIQEGDADAAARRMLRHLDEFEDVLAAQGRLDEPIVPAERWRRERFDGS
ncbi:FCD domain-containing protein [Nocardioides sp.]|uniref:FadR/GntR family transcriptional regulator n=1 Tax=Nocardioides sp. TaxID=35761 RepID=UPI002622B5A7|nr:FCD domain-containing protein [Nocardioides sp.]MDI6912517.1 FCD domain-containing protein [Nocardioides sp.]